MNLTEAPGGPGIPPDLLLFHLSGKQPLAGDARVLR